MGSAVTSLSCSWCGRSHGHLEHRHLCPCGGPLLVEYDLDRVAATASPLVVADRTGGMWRWRELLPVEDPGRIVSLGEGSTALRPSPRLADSLGLAEVVVKDEGSNPTGTFKARGASAGVTAAVERGARDLALPTAGNAGVAWATYGKAAGLAVHVAMPADAPAALVDACRSAGADLQLVDGLISDAGRAIAQGVDRHGWYDAGTLREPYRIEGKKTLGFEIVEQLGWRFPDVVVYPAGGGVGLIGMWRAFGQLRELGWATGDLPRLVVTQAEGCAPLVRAFELGADRAEAWEGADTIAHGLRVPRPFGDRLVLRALRETDGMAVAVSDDEIVEGRRRLGSEAGVGASLEGAAPLAAVVRLRERGLLDRGDRVVLVSTGSDPSPVPPLP